MLHARRVRAGLVARRGAEEESERAVARWEASLRAGEVDDGVRREELKAVEKLEVLLKVSKRHRVGVAKCANDFYLPALNHLKTGGGVILWWVPRVN